MRAAKKPKPPKKAPVSREATKRETREALVAAALSLFAEQGLDVPSLDAICDRAGYTRGAFYVHFKTREDILVAVMDHVGESFLASMFATAGAIPTGGKRFHFAVERFAQAVASGAYPLMSTSSKGPLVRPHQLLDACARSPAVRERYRHLVELSVASVAQLVAADQHDGDLRPDVDASSVASMALALIIGAQTMSELGLPLDPGRIGAAVERLLARA
ncbi:MAG: TetR/AcrR family transcriptional regulator [Labilithrix sp.]|nr:TetR/AcrR family transcriptional regulator [Labilithrix sp.]